MSTCWMRHGRACAWAVEGEDRPGKDVAVFNVKKCVTNRLCVSSGRRARLLRLDVIADVAIRIPSLVRLALSLALRLPSLLASCDDLIARLGQIVPRAPGDAFELVEVDQRPVHSHNAAELGLQLLASLPSTSPFARGPHPKAVEHDLLVKHRLLPAIFCL